MIEWRPFASGRERIAAHLRVRPLEACFGRPGLKAATKGKGAHRCDHSLQCLQHLLRRGALLQRKPYVRLNLLNVRSERGLDHDLE